jgi:hypothetical protein
MRTLGIVRRVGVLIGRRGASLLFVGMLAFVLAASLWWAPAVQRATPGYRVLSDLAPLWLWASAWTLSGVVCWVQAFVHQDRVAFALSTAMWWAYGIAYFVGAVSGVNPRGWVGGAIWVLFGAWINLIATWPESADVLPGGRRHARRD